jgi:teichuronic acid exporter
VTCLTLPLCVGLALVADDLIPVVLGEKWMEVTPLFQVFCLYALTHSVEVLLPPVLLARYRSGFLLKWTVALLVVMPGPFVAGALWRGAFGAAVALVLVYPWAMVWMAREALKELGLSAKELFRQLRPIAVPTGLMALSVVMVQWGLPTLELMQPLLRLVVASTIGAVVYVSAVSLMRRPLANEIWEVLGWILRRKQTVGLSDLASSHGAPAP